MPTRWLARAALWRRGAYRLLASVFLFPTPERVALWPPSATLLMEEAGPVEGLAFFPSVARALRRLAQVGSDEVAPLQEVYSTLFIGSDSRGVIPLHETGWVDKTSLAIPQVLASLDRLYRREGVSLSSQAYVKDHITAQLEFMALLCGRESEAWESGDAGEARRVLESQRGILGDHLALWVPSLERALAERDTMGVYHVTAQAVHGLVCHDAGLAEALLEATEAS